MSKVLIIITGGPGTGKSHMTKRILENIDGLTVLSYDDIKEKNFDSFGFDDNEQKNTLNSFSLEEFYLQLQKYMWLSRPVLIEYPFYQRHRARLQELIDTYHYRALSLYLHGDLKTIYDRGATRDHDDGRHPGHLTSSYHIETYDPDKLVYDAGMTYEDFCRMMEEKNYDVSLGKSISVDVTEIEKIPYDAVLQEISGMMDGRTKAGREGVRTDSVQGGCDSSTQA